MFVLGIGSSSSNLRRLVWVDRNGVASPLSDDRFAFAGPRVSADGRRVAVELGGPEGSYNPKTATMTSHIAVANVDLWIYDADRGTRTRQTFDGDSRWPIWSHDGNSVLFTAQPSNSEQDFRVVRKLVGRNEDTATLVEGTLVWASSLSSDGKWLAMSSGSSRTLDVDIERVDLSTGATKPFIATDAAEWGAEFSPAGGSVAYVSDETSRTEIYLTTYPASDRKYQVSSGGGKALRWSRDGTDLFFARTVHRSCRSGWGTSPSFVSVSPSRFSGTRLLTSKWVGTYIPMATALLPSNATKWSSEDHPRFESC